MLKGHVSHMRPMKHSRALLLSMLPLALPAQGTVPRLYLAPDLEITARQIKAEGSGMPDKISVAPDGRIIVFPKSYFGGIHAFDASGKSLGWKVAAEGPNAEIGWVGSWGWIGTTFWVGDPRYGQVVLVDPKGHVVRSIEYPSWVHPHWAERRKYPLFASMDVRAVYPDTSMLVVPLRPRSVLDTPGYDRSRAHLVHVNPSGAIEHTVATFATEGGILTLQGVGRSEHSMPVPFRARDYRAISADGYRVALVSPGVTLADSGTVRVVMLNEKGDTIFRRRYPQPAVRVQQAAVDSILARVAGFGSTTAQQVRSRLAARVPAFRSYVTDAFVGNDYTTWVVQRPVNDTATARDAVVLDAHGDAVALVALPVGITPLAVDRQHLWGINRAAYGIVRLKLQATPPPVTATPAPPSRSGTAAAAKARVPR